MMTSPLSTTKVIVDVYFPKVRFDDGQTTSVGWVYQRSYKLIFHNCYGIAHMASQCTLKIFHLEIVVENF